ncbi:hypothetical protein MA16_Dca006983 [Dendrobium catenatum]|uniref:Uncharacterized protein n=1 Tax=Dendrobium catenatum TaxID=906689 RepID=A0A2I0VX09_9ASPA|nr:hypothetical protein MA16_Dca006983 [Dendrobium catenatum]
MGDRACCLEVGCVCCGGWSTGARARSRSANRLLILRLGCRVKQEEGLGVRFGLACRSNQRDDREIGCRVRLAERNTLRLNTVRVGTERGCRVRLKFDRFVQKYSKQILLFGKAQKQISCDVINVHGVLNSPESSKNSSSTCSNTSELRLSEDEISISNPSHISKSTNGIEPNKEEFLVLPNEINFSLSNNEKQANETLQFNDPMLAYQNRKKIAKRNKTKTPKSSKAHILGSLAKYV